MAFLLLSCGTNTTEKISISEIEPKVEMPIVEGEAKPEPIEVTYSPQNQFDSANWLADMEGLTRYEMHQDLIKNHLRRGMAKASLESLVGALTCNNENHCQVPLGAIPNTAEQHFVHFELDADDRYVRTIVR